MSDPRPAVRTIYLPYGTSYRCEGSTVRGLRCHNWTNIQYQYRDGTFVSLCHVHRAHLGGQ